MKKRWEKVCISIPSRFREIDCLPVSVCVSVCVNIEIFIFQKVETFLNKFVQDKAECKCM